MLLAEGQRDGKPPAEAAPHPIVRAGLTKSQADDLLDWLEATGQGPAEFHPHGDGWAVSYLVPTPLAQRLGVEPR